MNELNTEDSIKIMVGIPGFIATPDKKMSKGWVSTSIQKYGLISEGTMPQMKYNKIDSCYYHVFPPVGETGSYLINIVFFVDLKFVNRLDTVIKIDDSENM